MVVGQATNNGGDYWVREFIHSCWSGDAPEAHEFRQRRTDAEKISLKADNLQQRQFKARLGGRQINRLLGEGIYS